MDKKTLETYDSRAKTYAEGWLGHPNPKELHTVAEKYFLKGAPTADIGSGSGRDTHWLSANGYPCVGFDASRGLIAEAKARFPLQEFRYTTLPNLKEIPDASFHNVLCETVIMHLHAADHAKALTNLLRIIRPGGTLSLSWRHPGDTQDARDAQGRLYEVIDAEKLLNLAARLGARCAFRATVVSATSGHPVDQLVLIQSR